MVEETSQEKLVSSGGKRKVFVGKLFLAIVLIVVVLLLVFVVLFFGLNKNQKSSESDKTQIDLNIDTVLFEKSESWGPCPPEGEPCSQSTKIYNSGKLVLEGNKNYEKKLDQETLRNIIRKIDSSGIMDKDCSYSGTVVDYYSETNLVINGKRKTIQYPGCEEELAEIEKLIPISDSN